MGEEKEEKGGEKEGDEEEEKEKGGGGGEERKAGSRTCRETECFSCIQALRTSSGLHCGCASTRRRENRSEPRYLEWGPQPAALESAGSLGEMPNLRPPP